MTARQFGRTVADARRLVKDAEGAWVVVGTGPGTTTELWLARRTFLASLRIFADTALLPTERVDVGSNGQWLIVGSATAQRQARRQS